MPNQKSEINLIPFGIAVTNHRIDVALNSTVSSYLMETTRAVGALVSEICLV